MSDALLELWLRVDRASVREGLRHGLLTKLLRPYVILERLIGGIVGDHFVLKYDNEMCSRQENFAITYDDIPRVQLPAKVIHYLSDMILEGLV